MKRLFLLSLVGLMMCGGSAARAQVLMRGDIDYATSGSRIRIFIEDITNFGSETTDRLRLRMFASRHHWQPTRPGRLIAFSLFPRLLPLEDREDILLSRPFRRPPSDWYYVTLTLEERTFDESGQVRWEIRDAVSFGQQYISNFDDFFPFD
jgi:hypothetical protein